MFDPGQGTGSFELGQNTLSGNKIFENYKCQKA